MDYKKIIRESWELTQANKSFIWLGSISAFLTTIVGIVYLAYQITSFKHSSIFGGKFDFTKTFSNLLEIIQNHTTLSIILGVLAIIIFILYLIVPLIISGALIDLIAKYKQDRLLKGGIAKGIVCLSPMVKYHALMSPFTLFSILIELSFIGRLSNIELLYIALPFFILFYLIGFILIILFFFTDQYIILNNSKFTVAMGESTRLVLVNFRETLFLILLMALISARIIINVILILFVPLAIITLTGYIASVILAQIGLYIGIGTGVILLFLVSYFIGTLTVFSTSVWTLSYLKMIEEEHL